MATVPGPPTCAPSSARSKLTALIRAPAPKASTSPMRRPGHGCAEPRSPPMTRDDAASAPHPSAAAISLAPAGMHLRRHATGGALRLCAARRGRAAALSARTALALAGRPDDLARIEVRAGVDAVEQRAQHRDPGRRDVVLEPARVLRAHGVVVRQRRPAVDERLLDRRLDLVVLLERVAGADRLEREREVQAR